MEFLMLGGIMVVVAIVAVLYVKYDARHSADK